MMTTEFLDQLGTSFEEAFVVIGALILTFEVGTGLWRGTLRRHGALDMLASLSTQIPFVAVEIIIFSSIYSIYAAVDRTYISSSWPLTAWSAIAAVVAADFVYYWEHRTAHEVRLFWTQHAVHHSSRHMNTSVAVRFGPFEGLLSAVFHFPLILVGFSAELVFFGIIIVQAYQSWIHTELVGKLGVLDRVLNTPANHRVHHGCNAKYIDKNYGGIFMIWDRLFGTYQQEEETPRYGLKRNFDSVNPIRVWFSEWPQFVKDVADARSLREACRRALGRPDGRPQRGE